MESLISLKSSCAERGGADHDIEVVEVKVGAAFELDANIGHPVTVGFKLRWADGHYIRQIESDSAVDLYHMLILNINITMLSEEVLPE